MNERDHDLPVEASAVPSVPSVPPPPAAPRLTLPTLAYAIGFDPDDLDEDPSTA